MDADTRPADVALAERIVRAAGIDASAIEDAATTNLDRLTALDRSDAVDRGEPITDPRDLWSHHSAKTMARFFAGRCVTCVNWTPGQDDGGTCTVVSEAIGFKTAGHVTATWGCTSYAEIPIDDMDTINARTELGFALGLLQPYPGE